jgi:hypothetical protein
LLATFLGAIPIGMLTLAILLFVRERSGSLAHAGVITGLYGAGDAIGLAAQGRLIDRYGQRPVLRPAGLICAVSLVVLVAFPRSTVGIVAAVLAGGSAPALTSGMRALIPALVPPAERAAAYALLSVSFQLASVLGPLLVSLLVTVSGPGSAILLAAAVYLVAVGVFNGSAASRGWRPLGGPAPVRNPGFWTLLASTAGTGLGAGLVTMAIPALAPQSVAALLFAAMSVGELTGGMAYGARTWRGRGSYRLAVALLGVAGTMAVIGASGNSAMVLVPLVFLAGGLGAPVGITQSALLDTVVPTGAVTRSYALMVCVGLLCSAGGNALGGALIGAIGAGPLFLIDAGGLGLVAGWTLLRRRSLDIHSVADI